MYSSVISKWILFNLIQFEQYNVKLLSQSNTWVTDLLFFVSLAFDSLMSSISNLILPCGILKICANMT